MKVAVCVPKQEKDRQPKLDWLDRTLGETDCDLFLTPQEYFGGHVMMSHDLHIEKDWLLHECGELAQKHDKALGVGACVKHATGGATEDYLYFERNGSFAGYHRKFALPSYDDVRTKGGGQLWPEISYNSRTTPVELKSVDVSIGTVFCWEVFAMTIVPAYHWRGANLIAHPVKFAPRGWLKLSKPKETGTKNVIGFDQAPKSEIWIDRLKSLSKHDALCPIAVSCNSWNLGEKYKALCGIVDEVLGTTDLHNVGSTPEQNLVKTYDVNPQLYTALRTSMHNMGAYKEVAGTVDHYHELGAWTMHTKMHRLESQLIGGSTRMDCRLMAATKGQQKKRHQMAK